MDALLEQLIVDFHERPLPQPTRRDVKLPAIPGKIDAVIGMRRTGKTWFLYQVMQDYLEQGVNKEAILYLNFDDERLLPLEARDLGRITDSYYRLFPSHRDRTCYLFFDEIQNVAGWQPWLRRLVDTEPVQITVTGSSAKLLSKEIATSLRGRSLSTEVFPFSLRESLRHEGREPEPGKRHGARNRALLGNRLRRYLHVGGFPEVQSLDDEYRIRVLQEYVDVVVLRDIVERHNVGNIQPLRYLIRHLLGAPATLFSINKFHNELKSQGIPCSKNTLYDYLDYLCDAYLIYPVTIHSRSHRARQVNPRKIYTIDPGLANAFLHRPQSDRGRLLENMVFMELRRRGVTIEYYRTRKELEVDFIVTDATGMQQLYQVSAELTEPATRQRELRALTAAMEETGLDQGTLLTLDETETITNGTGTINVLPVWSWVLEAQERGCKPH